MAKKILCIMFLSLLTACNSMSKLQHKDLSAKNFDHYLANNYLYLSEKEAKNYDWLDSDRFAKKGLQASKGMLVLPDNLMKRNLSKNAFDELAIAREELMDMLTVHNKAKFASDLAEAQMYFDCWVEEQEENWQDKEIQSCKSGFLTIMHHLHHKIYGKKHEGNFRHMKYNQGELPVKKYTVHFDLNSKMLDNEAIALIKQAKSAISEVNAKFMVIRGFADNTGGHKFNHWISHKRALAVKRALMNEGVSCHMMSVENHGSHHLAVPTPKGVMEKLNRRVEIDLYK